MCGCMCSLTYLVLHLDICLLVCMAIACHRYVSSTLLPFSWGSLYWRPLCRGPAKTPKHKDLKGYQRSCLVGSLCLGDRLALHFRGPFSFCRIHRAAREEPPGMPRRGLLSAEPWASYREHSGCRSVCIYLYT